jgi:hypothetical protein
VAIDWQTIGALCVFLAIVLGVVLVPMFLDRYFWGNK